jgi:hypothetical protein
MPMTKKKLDFFKRGKNQVTAQFSCSFRKRKKHKNTWNFFFVKENQVIAQFSCSFRKRIIGQLLAFHILLRRCELGTNLFLLSVLPKTNMNFLYNGELSGHLIFMFFREKENWVTTHFSWVPVQHKNYFWKRKLGNYLILMLFKKQDN